MDSPQNHIWGPNHWMILHSAAERIGQPHLQKMKNEESRIWIGLLASLRYSLPCPLCKKHYTDYYSSNPITSLTREFIRNWLYNLHSQVNSRTDKPNTITIDEIQEIYSKPFNFGAHLKIVSEHMTRALRLNWSSRDDILRSIRFYNEMKRFYDFF